MCGLTGVIEGSQSRVPLSEIVQKMADALTARGPDDEGIWFDEAARVALGFRRLSIIDLTHAGHQPMSSGSGRYVVVFNGEIYNFRELREELKDIEYRGHSDTEVLLEAFERWGVEEACRRFNGMFAFALWDRRDRRLYLGRDRFGEKPLYYGFGNDVFVFGSQLKALWCHPRFVSAIDREALSLYLRHGYVPTPHAIYENVKKVRPGTIVVIDGRSCGVVDELTFWSARRAILTATARPFEGSEDEAVDELDVVLTSAVQRRMVSDVPLGAFLSGGVDSSTVVALMQKSSVQPVKTFTIGFHERDFDEAEFAKSVASHLGTDHTELYISDREARDVVPSLPDIFDEPFADSSQIPTFLVSRLARTQVTVSLSGDGGDELFGGYDRYRICERFWSMADRLGPRARAFLGRGIQGVPVGAWRMPLALLSAVGAARRISADHIARLGEVLEVEDFPQFYRTAVSHWKHPEELVRGSGKASHSFVLDSVIEASLHPVEKMMYLDTCTYLPDDILTKVDRATMATSLEARVPFLDPEVFLFAWSLPLALRYRRSHGKFIVRRVLEKYVPTTLFERPKKGFGVPLAQWLRGPLRDWAEDLLDPRRMETEGYFRVPLIREVWREFIEGSRNRQHQIWDVLMFQAWLRVAPHSSRSVETPKSVPATSVPGDDSVRL